MENINEAGVSVLGCSCPKYY